jgi:hypothetical protein
MMDSFTCGIFSLSGNSTLLQKMQLKCGRHQTALHLLQLVPLKTIHEECVAGGTRVVTGLGLNGIRVWHLATLPQT